MLDEELKGEILCLKKIGLNFTDTSLITGIPIMTIWSIFKRAKKGGLLRENRSGHIKAISNKNLSILGGLKLKLPQMSAPKLVEKFKKGTTIYSTAQTLQLFVGVEI